MIITVTEPSNTMEGWQQELSTQESNFTTQLILPKSKFAEYLLYDSYQHKILSSHPLSVEFRTSEIVPNEYVRLKKHIKANANAKSIKLVLPDFLSPDNHVTAKLKNSFLKQKEIERIAEEKKKEEEEKIKAAQEYIENMTYYYNQDKVAVPFINTDFRKCLFKVNGVCFGQPFYTKGMSYMDCKAEKDKLGIKECYESSDNWAATVKICGGVKNLPSAKDLSLLASDLYGKNLNYINEINTLSPESNRVKLQRINSKNYLEYFRNTYWNTQFFDSGAEEGLRNEFHFTVYSNQETGKKRAMVRIFDNDYTEYTDYPREASNPISVCIGK
jgi:hypothetical protein